MSKYTARRIKPDFYFRMNKGHVFIVSGETLQAGRLKLNKKKPLSVRTGAFSLINLKTLRVRDNPKN